jgi:hypothetical protein
MKERIAEEINLLKGKYPNLQHGENYDWVLIPDFPLPEGWSRKEIKLLFLIPSSYPHAAPDNFYVETGLRVNNGSMPSNYSEGTGVPIGGAWGCFSWHPEHWQASSKIQEGDNLLSFMKAVNIRLREVN